MILPNTSLWHEDAAQSRAPLGSSTDRQTGTDQKPTLGKKSVSQFIIAPRAQASRRCETQAPLRRQAAKLCQCFGPLTPSARSANLIAGDGTKNGFPAPNKEPATNQNNYLTGKAPYKFESGFLQWRVRCELDAAVLFGRPKQLASRYFEPQTLTVEA